MAAEEDEFSEALYLMLQREKRVKFREELKRKPQWAQIKNEWGMTLLHLAVQNKDVEAIEILIENNADLSYEEDGVNKKKSVLHYAAIQSYFFAIYLAALARSLMGKDLMPLVIEILPPIIVQKFKFTLWQTLQQTTPQKFEGVLWQILEEANPEDFSPHFNAVLTHVRAQKSYNMIISELIMILQHANDLDDFALLLREMIERIYSKSLSAPSSPMIHSSSPIYSPRSSSRETSSDESVLDDDTFVLDTAMCYRRRGGFP